MSTATLSYLAFARNILRAKRFPTYGEYTAWCTDHCIEPRKFVRWLQAQANWPVQPGELERYSNRAARIGPFVSKSPAN